MALILVNTMFLTIRNPKVQSLVLNKMLDLTRVSVSRAVLTVSTLLHLVILLRLSLSHCHHLRPLHVFQINYFLGLGLLCASGETQFY